MQTGQGIAVEPAILVVQLTAGPWVVLQAVPQVLGLQVAGLDSQQTAEQVVVQTGRGIAVEPALVGPQVAGLNSHRLAASNTEHLKRQGLVVLLSVRTGVGGLENAPQVLQQADGP